MIDRPWYQYHRFSQRNTADARVDSCCPVRQILRQVHLQPRDQAKHHDNNNAHRCHARDPAKITGGRSRHPIPQTLHSHASTAGTTALPLVGGRRGRCFGSGSSGRARCGPRRGRGSRSGRFGRARASDPDRREPGDVLPRAGHVEKPLHLPQHPADDLGLPCGGQFHSGKNSSRGASRASSRSRGCSSSDGPTPRSQQVRSAVAKYPRANFGDI